VKRSLPIVSTTGFVVALSTIALADARSAAVCAKSLTVDQKLIYQSVLPDLTREADLTALVRAKVIALVGAGRLPMSSAPDDAKIAGRCLQMAHQ
jgi:hypothetical protein